MKKMLPMLVSAVLLAPPASAHHLLKDFSLPEMAERSSLVFHGKIIDIAYKNSTKAKNGGSVPHTFVTYSIDDVLQGDPDRDTLTLRFMGGLGEDGSYMISTDSPQFKIGDEDVLFVSGNEVKECPLVDCANGRFRVVDGMMFNEFGQQLVESGNGKIAFGEVSDRPEFITYQIGNKKITLNKQKSNSREFNREKKSDSGSAKEPHFHLDAPQFIAQTRNKIQYSSATKNNPVRHADISRNFTMPAASASVAKNIIDKGISPNAISLEEQRVRKAIDGNATK